MFDIDVVQKSIAEDSYYEFFKMFWSVLETRELSLNWSQQFIAEELQIVAERVIATQPKQSDFMLNASPGQSKSRMCTELFSAWLLARNPGLKIIVGSFSLDTSNKFSGEIRKVMESELYKKYWPGSVLAKGENRISRFYTIANGSVETVSPGSATTTKHADVIILDDISSAGQAASATLNASIIQWFEESLKSRVTSIVGTPFIVIGQRYHSQDIFNHLLEKTDANYRHLVLPALLNENIKPGIETIRERFPVAYVDGTFDAIRMPMEAMKSLESATLPDVFGSQYQQDAPDLRTVIFQSDWVEQKEYADGIILGKGKTRNVVVDPAAGGGDDTAIGIFFYADGALYLEACYAVKYAWGKLVPYIHDILSRHNIGNKSKVLIENTSSGIQLIPELAKSGYNALPVSHGGKSKEQRMNDDAVLTPVMANRFKIIKGQNSNKAFAQFTGPLKMRNDDIRDMIVYGIKHLMQSSSGNGNISMMISGANGQPPTIIKTGENSNVDRGNQFLKLKTSNNNGGLYI